MDTVCQVGSSQTMEGYDRAMTDGRTETDEQKYGQTHFNRDGQNLTGTQAQLKVLNCRQKDAGS